jgi:MerR family transcriptional regulator, light-induced transcriptional regulator
MMSTRELADALGASESTLKRWIDSGRIAGLRTEGGHRRVPLTEAVRFIRDRRAPVARPELLDLPEISSHRARGEQLVTYLLEGDSAAARGFLAARYLEGARIAELADGPIRDAMHTLGELWRHDDGGIFIEHRATDICLHAVSLLRMVLPSVPATAAIAIGGAPAGDPYLLPSLLASLTVAEAGMTAVNLGPDTPRAAFDAAIARHRPKLLWLSVSAALATARARELVTWLDHVPETIAVVVGGQHAHTVDRLPPRCRRATSMAQLADAVTAVEMS